MTTTLTDAERAAMQQRAESAAALAVWVTGMKPSDTRMVLAEFDDGSFALGNFGKVVFYHVKNGMVQSTPDELVRRWLDFGDGSRTAVPALARDVLSLLALYEASQAALTGALAELAAARARIETLEYDLAAAQWLRSEAGLSE